MVLFINSCVRAGSRTKYLADVLLKRLDQPVQEVTLMREALPTLTEADIDLRGAAARDGSFTDPVFQPARQFAAADTVVIAAPFWDLSFPALLKRYIESVCVNGITFRYSPEGVPVGMCRAKKLFYVTTSGGPIINSGFGYGYIKTLAQTMFGIPECVCFSAENLDIRGSDENEILESAARKIREYPL